VEDEPRIWSVLDRDHRLVLAVSDEPGIFNFTKPPEDDVDPVECEFATLQCYSLKAEPEMLRLLFAARDLEEFLETLMEQGYKVIEGRPRADRIARL
jgi:hypothetical protein